MEKNNEQYLGHRKLINQIIKLCFDINDKTKRTAFFWYSGHVGIIDIRICKGKEYGNYNINLLQLNVSPNSENKIEELNDFKSKLIEIINDPTNYDK